MGASLQHITIIRPITGLEPLLYECLASTFRQTYPSTHLHIRFCVPSLDEPSIPTLQRLLHDFPSFDVQIMVEAEDTVLQDGTLSLGPNPKIRNMSRAYREAVGDVVWIIDCNVWIAKDVCGRMVALLEGHDDLNGNAKARKNKFVHQLPLVIETIGETGTDESTALLVRGEPPRTTNSAATSTLQPSNRGMFNVGGGRLEESFMSSSHAKFYTAINTVLIAPCVVGKSTMFRPSHLNALTSNRGIDFFSENICEDHLIGDLLWKQKVPGEGKEKGEVSWGKHAMLYGDLAIQPMSSMSLGEYWRRRVRWLRVRKYTVTLATLVEPGTESLLCSAYGAFAFATLLSDFRPWYSMTFGQWNLGAVFFILSVTLWCAADYTLHRLLQSGRSLGIDAETPVFARGTRKRRFGEWLIAWLGREVLALPIWIWAFWGGATVDWRGRRFWVGRDMRVHEICEHDNNMNMRRAAGGKLRCE